MSASVLVPAGRSAEFVRDAISRLSWRSALPADAMPPHQYVVFDKCPTDAWDVLADTVRGHPDSYDAYFRGYPFPMHYWEFEGHRYWRTSGKGPTHMLNWCTLDSVEPPRRVDEGARPIEWEGPPWAPNGSSWPPGYVPGPGPAHMKGMVYRSELDPRAAFPCADCGITYLLYEPERPCPRCGRAPDAEEMGRRQLG